MTSLQRVLTTLGHEEPDRVPLFLLVTMHGAKELGTSIQDYFSHAENVVAGQLAMRAKYRNDCLYPFFYAPIEVEAFGAEVVFVNDGPPNSGRPLIRSRQDIAAATPPPPRDVECLARVLRAIELLKAEVGDDAPIIGVAMSPFSLPVMQMGFDRYLDLLHEDRDGFDRLMQVNEEFCVNWANAQLESGATAICYFDPVSSSTVIPRDLYLQTGFEVARRTLARIQGPTATHMASGRCLPIVDDIARTGTAAVGTSADEDLATLEQRCRGKLALLGNLNGIEMRRWGPRDAERAVRTAIAGAGRGGGYILADNHGEIPWQVPEEVLLAVSEAVRTWGSYPLAGV